MPEKKIVEMPAEVTVIVDKVSEVTQSKTYGKDFVSGNWVPLALTDDGFQIGMVCVDEYGYLKFIRVDPYGRPAVKIDSDSVGLAKETTLSSINGKITKCDTDNTTVSKRVSDSFSHGQVDVGTSAVQLTSSSTPCKFGVVIKADDDNSGNVYIGGSGVTTSNGFRLKAGQGISFEIDDASKVYAIADSTGQKVHWIAV